MSTGGNGYRVEVDSLRAFAAQVRGLLKEFEDGAGGSKVHGMTSVGSSAFGNFAEAEALHAKYGEMRDTLKQVLDGLQAAIDEVQQRAERTATNYEEQEHGTVRQMKLDSDGWSVGGAPTLRTTSSAGSRSRSGVPQDSRPPAGNSSPAGSGEPHPTW
ncbi:hypothetical protein AB0K51_18530 [Kitasatospora sp. NPDC049285]|uniref:hypothetical protein n=1 Tax=Kitasatospora sp. NPDC049285 TaxID=3157096 RepID=UPI003431CF5E